MLCVLILYNSGTYSLKSTVNDRFFKKLFMAILFTLRANTLPIRLLRLFKEYFKDFKERKKLKKKQIE